MPIREASTRSLTQVCAACGAVHTIPLRHGAAKARRGPYPLTPADTLEVQVGQGAEVQVVQFAAAPFATRDAAPAEDVAAWLARGLAGANADVDGGAVRLVSESTDPAAGTIQVTGGSARAALGFDGRAYGPLRLGVTKGTGAQKRTAPDTIDLPHCPDCGAKECLVRTWDVMPASAAATFVAQHRRVVNSLAAFLKVEGYSDPDAKHLHDAESSRPLDILADFSTQAVQLVVPGDAARATAEEPPTDA